MPPRKSKKPAARTDSAQFWMDRLERSRQKRMEWQFRWDQVKVLLNGQEYLTEEWDDEVRVNLAHSTMQTDIPKSILQNPKFAGRPKREGSERSAKVMAEVDNYYMKELKFVPEWRECVADTKSHGIGIFKMGYVPKEDKFPEIPDEEEPKSESEQVLEELDELEEELTSGLEMERPHRDAKVLLDPFIKRNSFFGERHDPEMFLWDAAYTKPRKWRWIGFESIVPIEAIKKNPLYRKKARSAVQATQVFTRQTHENGTSSLMVISPAKEKPDIPTNSKMAGNQTEDQFDKVTEIWDWENQKLIIVADSAPDVLYEGDWPYPTEGFPAAFLRYNITYNQPVPLSDLQAAIPQLREINYVRRHQADHLKRFNRKYAITREAFEDNESMESLENGADGTLVPVPNGPSDITPIQDATVSPDYARHEANIKNDYREIVAQTELERGSATGIDSATEAAILDANSRVRSSYQQSITEEFIQESMRVFNQLLRAWLPPGVVIKITGREDSEVEWVDVKREDIQGEYDVEVIPGSTVPMSPAVRQQQLIQYLQIVAPFVSAGMINPVPILREIAELMEIRNVDEMLNLVPGAPDITAPGADPSVQAAVGGLSGINRENGQEQGGGLSGLLSNIGGLGGQLG